MLKFFFDADFRAEKSQEGLRRKRNDRRGQSILGPMILKIVVFEARRSSFTFTLILGSEARKQG